MCDDLLDGAQKYFKISHKTPDVLCDYNLGCLAGGWPKDVDFSEQADVTRFRKKAEKDEEYKVGTGRISTTTYYPSHIFS